MTHIDLATIADYYGLGQFSKQYSVYMFMGRNIDKQQKSCIDTTQKGTLSAEAEIVVLSVENPKLSKIYLLNLRAEQNTDMCASPTASKFFLSTFYLPSPFNFICSKFCP